MDSTPLVCITGQVRSELLGTDAFQEADIVGLTLAATKWSYQITDPSEVESVVHAAFAIARDGRPGPVLIDITRDAQAGLFAVTQARAPLHPPAGAGTYAATSQDLTELRQAAELINNAKRPFLLIGQGVLLARAEGELVALAETAGIPVASTLLGLSAMPANHPLYVGMLGMHGNYAPNVLTNEADIIVAVGMRFDDRVTGRLDDYARVAQIVHIEIDPAEVGRHVPAAVALIADARDALTRLLPLLHKRDHPHWLARFHELGDRGIHAGNRNLSSRRHRASCAWVKSWIAFPKPAMDRLCWSVMLVNTRCMRLAIIVSNSLLAI